MLNNKDIIQLNYFHKLFVDEFKGLWIVTADFFFFFLNEACKILLALPSLQTESLNILVFAFSRPSILEGRDEMGRLKLN